MFMLLCYHVAVQYVVAGPQQIDKSSASSMLMQDQGKHSRHASIAMLTKLRHRCLQYSTQSIKFDF